MADFSSLKTAIQNAIRTNGNNEITGQLLQDILLSMVVVLGDEAITNVADDLSTETSQRQNADGTLQGNINAEATERAVADTALQNAINTINSNISNGYVYAGIATPSATPVTGKVFYIATTAGTYTNFGGLTVTKGINILKYNGSTWSQEQIIGIDDYPTAGSSGLALSGGVDAEIKSLVGYYTCGTAAATAAKTITASAYILLQGGSIKVKFTYKNTAADATLKIGSADAKPLFYGGRRAGSSNSWEAGEVVEIFYDGTNYMANNVMGGGAGDGAFDISVYNAVDGTPTPYADLAAALGTNGANIPDTLRKGGMSVKFIQGTVQSSDNKYVQARCMAQDFTTDVAQWQEVEENPTFESINLIESGGVVKYVCKKIELQNTFEIGGIDGLDSNSWTYVSYPYLLRTKQNTYLHLNVGDIIHCSDYSTIKMYIGCKDDYTKGTQGWITHDFEIQYKGEYVINTGYIVGGDVTVEELGSKFVLMKKPDEAAYLRVDENPTPGSKNLVESGGVDEKISYHGFNDLTTAEADIVGVSSNGSIVDQITRKISTAPTNNRVLIGPFHFTHDTEITIDDGYRYIIYYLFPDDTTAYSQMYNTWQTGKHIIGVHPKYKDEIMYYIMLSKTDNGAMTNILAYEYKKIIHLKNVDGENPLHLIFCDSWTADATPKGNNSISPAMYQRLWGEKEAEKNMYCYFGNNTLVFSAYNNGQEFLSNIHRPFILPQKGNTKFLIRKNETYNTEFRDCTSFSQLYSIINFNKEYFDFKRIEGNNIFAGAQALTAGNNFLTNLSDGLVIQGENIGYSHVPSLKFYDSKAYVTMQTDTSGQEGSSNTTILISEIDVSNNQIVNNYIVAGLGTYGGVTFDGGCNNPYSYIVGSTLHIIYNAHINGGLYLAHCAFNLNSKEFTNEICSIEHNSETKDFNDANIHSLFGAETGIKGYDSEFVASQIATDGTYYYVTISSGNFEDGKTPIMFTSDFSIWKLFVVPDMEYGSDCEIAIAISGGYLYGASRHYYRDCTLCIWKMDLSTKKVVDSVQINDCATRPTFYVKSGEVFLVHGLDSRKCLQIIWIYKNMLAQSSCYLECQDERILGYNSFEYDGTYTYIAIQRGISGISTPRNVFAKLTVI